MIDTYKPIPLDEPEVWDELEILLGFVLQDIMEKLRKGEKRLWDKDTLVLPKVKVRADGDHWVFTAT